MTTRPLLPVLARQLKRLSVDPNTPPSAPVFAQLLDIVNEHYYRMDDDRGLLNRSLELSTNEMDVLRRGIEAQRDQLSAVIGTIGDALSQFGATVQAQTNTAQIAAAKAQFTSQLQGLLDRTRIGDDSSSDVSTIRSNLVRLADNLITMLADAAERATLKSELEVARTIQQLLIPQEAVIERPQLRIVGYFQPAAECGGDWWTVSDLAEGKLLTVVGDVTGHGVSAAIITGAAKASCDLAVHVTRGHTTPSELLAMMNVALHRTGRRQVMMTCVAAVIDTATRTLALANAGHPLPFLIRQGIIHPLTAEGAPLGDNPDSVYKSVNVQIDPGDVLVCFTDGVVECENRHDEQFSERRLRAVCQRAAPGGAHKVRDAVVEALDVFRNGQSLADDVTLIATVFQ